MNDQHQPRIDDYRGDSIMSPSEGFVNTSRQDNDERNDDDFEEDFG